MRTGSPTTGAAVTAAPRTPVPRRATARRLEPLSEDDVRLAQGRDQAAFERLYRSRIGPISRYVAAIIRDATRAEDVTAQTFLLAWRDLAKLRQPDRFDAWLFRIARNQAISEVTRRKPTTALDESPEIADPGRFGAPDRELEYATNVEELRDAIVRLPETQQQVLYFRYFQELPPAEIARRTGKNEQSIWALTYRALQNLRRYMQEDVA